jgi:hypothetical protein
MKRFMLAGFSILLVSATTTSAVTAETTATNSAALGSAPDYLNSQITPFNLVSLAYRGYLRSQGIPSYSLFLSAYRMGSIRAEDIVSSAVEANRLPADALTDRDYLKAVETQLDNLESY